MKRVVEQNRSFVKDMKTNAVVNSDRNSYNAYMQRVRQKQEQNDKLRDVVRDINILKIEMYEIKELLKKVVK
jgi:hypothetical protein